MDVVALGEGLLRLSTLDHHRLDQAHRLEVGVAGAELNVAVALSSLGATTSWVSAIPDSPVGRLAEREAARAGVDTSAVQRIPDTRMGLFFVEFGAGARPTSVWYDREGSAFRSMADPDPDLLHGARFLVVSGVTYALDARMRTLAGAFTAAAAEREVSVCFDVNYRDRLWSPEQARDVLAPVLATADVVVCSERDARSVFGCSGDHQDVLQGVVAQCRPDATMVVLTRGEHGAIATTAGGGLIDEAAVPTVVVDRFGAGDAFTAGLLWGLLQGDPAIAVRAGNALAALKCSVPGDFAQFTPAELVRTLSDDNPGLLR
jgi:2-dehydro-3-deoxygluconokinase